MPNATPVPNRARLRAGRLAISGAAAALTAAALAAAITTPSARAATTTYTPLEGALECNAFVENDTVLASTEAEGPIATGGDLVVDGLYNVSLHSTGTFTADGNAQPSALVVGGGIDFADSAPGGVIRVLGQGYVKVGDLSGTDVCGSAGRRVGGSAGRRVGGGIMGTGVSLGRMWHRLDPSAPAGPHRDAGAR